MGSPINIPSNVSEDIRLVLQDMANSGSSETIGVADILATIASNGDGQEDKEFLITCAQEIKEAADNFICRLRATDKQKEDQHATNQGPPQ